MEALGTSRPTVRSKPKVSKTSSSKTESRVSSEIASKSTTSSQQAQNLDKLNTNNITSTARVKIIQLIIEIINEKNLECIYIAIKVISYKILLIQYLNLA